MMRWQLLFLLLVLLLCCCRLVRRHLAPGLLPQLLHCGLLLTRWLLLRCIGRQEQHVADPLITHRLPRLCWRTRALVLQQLQLQR